MVLTKDDEWRRDCILQSGTWHVWMRTTGKKNGGRPIELWNLIATLLPNGPIYAHFEFDSFLIQDSWLNSRIISFCKQKGGKLLTQSIFSYPTKMVDKWNGSANIQVYLPISLSDLLHLYSVWLQIHKKEDSDLCGQFMLSIFTIRLLNHLIHIHLS